MTSPLANVLNAETMATPAESTGPLKGTGGGLADMIPATIDNQQPAALSEGEFVVPADVVSMLGDGSSDAGARILGRLIEEIRGKKQKGDTEQAGAMQDLMT